MDPNSSTIHDNVRIPIITILLIEITAQKSILCGNELSLYNNWSDGLLNSIASIYNLNSKELHVFESSVLANQSILDSIQQKSFQKLAGSLTRPSYEDVLLSDSFIKHTLFGVLQSSKMIYDSRLRALLRRVIKSCSLQLINESKSQKSVGFLLSLIERDCIESLSSVNNPDEGVINDKYTSKKNLKKWIGVGMATVAGGILIGVTGGLATPLIATGLGTIATSMGVVGAGASVAALGSVTGAALVGTLFGVTGAGLAGYKLNRRLKDLDEFFFEPINDVPSLSYTIVISGWISHVDAARDQWHNLGDSNPLLEVLVLHFDRQCLVDLTKAATEFIKSNIISYSASSVAAMTSAAALAIALTLPIGMLTAISLLDNPWNMALTKSLQAGALLAQVLVERVGGSRPVSLIGHGMGARVIVFCLLELYSLRDKHKVYGIVESVYLFGASVCISVTEWRDVRSLVAHRFVNCYSENDWFLKILFRLNSNRAAGTCAIECEGVENVDVSSMITSHDQYIDAQTDLLLKIQFEQH